MSISQAHLKKEQRTASPLLPFLVPIELFKLGLSFWKD